MADFLALSWLWLLLLVVVAIEQLGWWVLRLLIAQKEQRDELSAGLDELSATLKQATRATMVTIDPDCTVTLSVNGIESQPRTLH